MVNLPGYDAWKLRSPYDNDNEEPSDEELDELLQDLDPVDDARPVVRARHPRPAGVKLG